MTREEEILQAWDEERKKRVGTGDMVHFDSFLLGARYADEHPKNPWSDTKKDPPKAGVEVIGYWPSWDGSISKCAYDADTKLWFMDMILCEEPDYWMPIPETPKEE